MFHRAVSSLGEEELGAGRVPFALVGNQFYSLKAFRSFSFPWLLEFDTGVILFPFILF
jgi:hypothetical protein